MNDVAGSIEKFFARGNSYWLTRFVILRLLGFVYAIAFLVAARQLVPLIGHRGLTPADFYLSSIHAELGSRTEGMLHLPTLFWFGCTDLGMSIFAWVGFALSLIVLSGYANAILLAVLWGMYMSIVHIGQIWYGYGWEIQLLETGFLSIFLCPLLDGRPFPKSRPPILVIWLFRWLGFRIMLGAGLIKLRGDPCWRDLTCMLYHYETQPLPNPLSWYLHQLPPAFHKFELLGNHFVELIVPWTLFAPRRLRHLGGVFLVGFQVYLIFSGNLSWLNWLTIALCIPCFDDGALARLVPARLRDRLAQLREVRPTHARQMVTYGLTALVAYLSIGPVSNLLGARQAMNASFDRLHLVNTYGAFGSVGKVRMEIVFEGTDDETLTERTKWREYEFKAKPGNPMRRPAIVAPY